MKIEIKINGQKIVIDNTKPKKSKKSESKSESKSKPVTIDGRIRKGQGKKNNSVQKTKP